MTAVVMGCLMMWKTWPSMGMRPTVLSATTDMTVEQRLASLESRVYSLEKKAGGVKSKSTNYKENFLNLSGGSMRGSEWVKIPSTEFWFDSGFYGEVVEATWQGWVDNGYGYVRLYDASNHRVVDGSEVLVNSSEKASFYSKPLSIWRGMNQYWLEAKSPINETVTVSGPRIRLMVR